MGPRSRLRRVARSARSHADPTDGAVGPLRLALSLRESWPPCLPGVPERRPSPHWAERQWGPSPRLRRRSLRSRRVPTDGAVGPPRLALSLRESWPPIRCAALAPAALARAAPAPAAPAARAFAARKLAVCSLRSPPLRCAHSSRSLRCARSHADHSDGALGPPRLALSLREKLAAWSLRCARSASPPTGRWGPCDSRFRARKLVRPLRATPEVGRVGLALGSFLATMLSRSRGARDLGLA